MPRAHSQPPGSSAAQSNAVSMRDYLTSEEYSYLEDLLKHKLRGIPSGHLPDIRLSDIVQQTSVTRLSNGPADIGLRWFLRNRALVDSMSGMSLKDDRDAEEQNGAKVDGVRGKLVRAIWFYRLDPARQFQRWHDDMRWNLAICIALVTAHSLRERKSWGAEYHGYENGQPSRQRAREDDGVNVNLSPAAVRFLTSYLAAVLEHHNTPSLFSAREAFIRIHRASSLDLFRIHKAWAKKALQKEMKRLSREWEMEVSCARRELPREEYEDRVERLVGSLVPGRVDQCRRTGLVGMESGSGCGQDAEGRGDENEMLSALRVPCPVLAQKGSDQRTRKGAEEGAMVCELRTAITCVQNMRARDMLPMLMRLFPPHEVENETRG